MPDNDLYTIHEILDKYELPVKVKKRSWTNDFYFSIEYVSDDGYAHGSAFLNGQPRKRPFGLEYKYKISELFSLYGHNTLKEENFAADTSEMNNRQLGNDDLEGAKRINEGENTKTTLPNYVAGITELYVQKNGEWHEATFSHFDNMNGGNVIYVVCDNTESFYAFPSEFVKESKAEVKEIENVKKKSDDLLLSENIEAGLIAKEYCAYPLSTRPMDTYDDEFGVEENYHRGVNLKLDEFDALENQKLDDAIEIENIAQKTLTAAIVEDRESDVGYDPFNPLFRESEGYHNKSVRMEAEAHDRLIEISRIRQNPYIARMDCGPSFGDLHTVYLGYSDIENLVVDWRNSAVGNAYYYSAMLRNAAELTIGLKRIITFNKSILEKFKDEINIYNGDNYDEANENTDSLFLTLLSESRDDKKVHDIVRTIQQNQYRIITSNFNKNLLVNGCAGSGKTMILYHRLSYIAYNDSNNFNPENVFAITPSNLFLSLTGELIDQLELRTINNTTFSNAINIVINRYRRKNHMHGFIEKINYSAEKIRDYQLAQNKFDSAIKNIYQDPSQFIDWFITKINSELTKHNITAIDPVKFYRALAFKMDISELVSKIIHSYDESIEHEKRSLDRQGNRITTKEVTFSNYIRNIAKFSAENINALNVTTSRMKVLDRYRDDLDEVLNSKTFLTKEGKVSTDFPVTILDNPGKLSTAICLLKFEKLFNSFMSFFKGENPKSLYPVICEYALSSIYEGNPVPENANLLILKSMTERFEEVDNNWAIFFIDEFQNYSPYEIEVLKMAYPKAIFNLFGDYGQQLEDNGIDEKYFAENFDGAEFSINENYRNALEITQYINDQLGKHMMPIGLHGTVKIENAAKCSLNIDGRTALILEDLASLPESIMSRSDINIISDKSNTMSLDKINVLTVAMAKGIEFDTVYVVDAQMSDNEKYVAYTRALNKLVVVC